MKRAAFALIIAAAVLAVGCATTAPDPNYAAYVRFVEQQAQAEDARFAAITATADRCQSDTCVQQVAALAAVAQAAGGRSAPTLQQYQRQPSTAERVGLALIGQVGPLASAAVAWNSSNNSRDIALGQFDFLGGIVESVAQSPALQPPAAPAITVGGDYITGSQHTGDDVGGDQIVGDQHIGDAVGGDQIGGDRIDGSNVGTGNRLGSDGPIDNSGQCTGETCQGTPPPATPDPEG